MIVSEPAATLTDRPRRRFRRLVGAAVVLCVLALFVAFTLWAARPRWYTFVSKPTQTSPAFSLVLRVPLGWECREEGEPSDDTVVSISIRHKLPIGLARLWQQVVLRENRTPDSSEQRSIQLIYSNLGGSDSDSEYFRFLAGGSLESDLTATTRTFKHPLGPALERTHGREEVVHDEVTRIVVLQHPQGTRIEVIASRTGPYVALSRTRSQWVQMVRSIRVVQK